MKSSLFFAILLSCRLAEMSSQATDCEMGKENCNADSSGCTGASDLLKDFCNMTAEPEDDVKLLWESSALAKFGMITIVDALNKELLNAALSLLMKHGGSRSCLEMTMFCIQDEICNRLLVPQIKACSENHNKCNATQCQRAVQKFYDNLPPKVAGMLVFCDCGPSDEPCQQVQGILHARLCSGDRDLPPTCLEVIDKCMEDTFCRERYELLQSKCWGDEKGLCQDYDNDKDCLLTPAEESTTCMRYHECRAAYIGTRGTFLQVPCICNGLQNTEQSTCKQFQNMLRHRSCSTHVSTSTSENIPLPSDTLETAFTTTGLYPLFNGTLICIIAYIIVIIMVAGVIMLILHKTRVCRTSDRSKYIPPVDTNDCPAVY